MNVLNEVLLGIGQRGEELPGSSFDMTPTQGDKPSPHSSLTINQAYQRLYKAFPKSQGFLHGEVANTNSMEPFIDAGIVNAYEDLTGKWRDVFLKRQPFVAGDIVVYRDSQGRGIIHVLKKKTEFLGRPAWVIQGANNKLPDFGKIPEHLIYKRWISGCVTRQTRKND